MPSPRDVDAYASAYADDIGFETELVRLRRQHVLRAMKEHSSRRVLEIGCGLDPLFCHREDFERHVTVEPARLFFERAEAFAAGRAAIRVVHARFEEAAAMLAGEDFDFVVLSGLLHEVNEPDPLLHAIAALCGPQTVVHVNVPNARSFHRLLAHEMGLLPDLFETSALGKTLQRSREYDREQLETAVRGAGFRVLRFQTYALKPFTHAQMTKLTQSAWCPPGLVDGLDRMVKYAPDLGCEMSVEMIRDDFPR